MNLHAPQRQANESQADYRARRAASNAAVKRATHTPKQAPAVSKLDVSRFFMGQHTNPAKAARRARIKLIGKRQFRKIAAAARS